MLVCRYIDHYSCDKKDLGIFYQKKDHPFKGSVLSTCHRIEVIDNVKSNIPSNFEMKGYISKRISGEKDVSQRLAKIASGVESIILGEPFIFDQVKRAFKKEVTDPLIYKTVQKSLELAKIAKEKYNFYSNSDYSDIAIKLLGNASDVVIIGSGMLAKAVADKLSCDPTMITRNTKSAKKKFKSVSKITNLPEKPFKCIIATTNTEKHRQDVDIFLNKSKCSLVIDLSAIPFLENPKFKYITMYDKVFEEEIEKANDTLLSKVESVNRMICKEEYE